ncbi:hypothetical protein HYH03_009689 [Edaphochlamys debaryana]|uniref:FAD/NAD(P)-binding domain-containing protein n=1 Tax=Edaphochlamys debaryana TaxID=47281 RepID=A0A835XXC1_9CHLO|nr:hypothetical protein HYH03_009689 [Edaphochlamys debaryana]|eukprot:KAG2491958.1 hypothetical protein HYH03_009689 [Edaphochlamys debaryana]
MFDVVILGCGRPGVEALRSCTESALSALFLEHPCFGSDVDRQDERPSELEGRPERINKHTWESAPLQGVPGTPGQSGHRTDCRVTRLARVAQPGSNWRINFLDPAAGSETSVQAAWVILAGDGGFEALRTMVSAESAEAVCRRLLPATVPVPEGCSLMHATAATPADISGAAGVTVFGDGGAALDSAAAAALRLNGRSVRLVLASPPGSPSAAAPRIIDGAHLLDAARDRALRTALQPHPSLPPPGAVGRALRAPTKRRFWGNLRDRVAEAVGGGADRQRRAAATASTVANADAGLAPAAQGGVRQGGAPQAPVHGDAAEREPAVGPGARHLVLWAPSPADPRVWPFLGPELRAALTGAPAGALAADGEAGARGPELVLYRGVVHPSVPGLAFVGCTAHVGSSTGLMQMQARWAAALASGALSLPPPAAVAADLERQRAWRAAALTSPLRQSRTTESYEVRQIMADLSANAGPQSKGSASKLRHRAFHHESGAEGAGAGLGACSSSSPFVTSGQPGPATPPASSPLVRWPDPSGASSASLASGGGAGVLRRLGSRLFGGAGGGSSTSSQRHMPGFHTSTQPSPVPALSRPSQPPPSSSQPGSAPLSQHSQEHSPDVRPKQPRRRPPPRHASVPVLGHISSLFSRESGPMASALTPSSMQSESGRSSGHTAAAHAAAAAAGSLSPSPMPSAPRSATNTRRSIFGMRSRRATTTASGRTEEGCVDAVGGGGGGGFGAGRASPTIPPSFLSGVMPPRTSSCGVSEYGGPSYESAVLPTTHHRISGTTFAYGNSSNTSPLPCVSSRDAPRVGQRSPQPPSPLQRGAGQEALRRLSDTTGIELQVLMDLALDDSAPLPMAHNGIICSPRRSITMMAPASPSMAAAAAAATAAATRSHGGGRSRGDASCRSPMPERPSPAGTIAGASPTGTTQGMGVPSPVTPAVATPDAATPPPPTTAATEGATPTGQSEPLPVLRILPFQPPAPGLQPAAAADPAVAGSSPPASDGLIRRPSLPKEQAQPLRRPPRRCTTYDASAVAAAAAGGGRPRVSPGSGRVGLGPVLSRLAAPRSPQWAGLGRPSTPTFNHMGAADGFESASWGGSMYGTGNGGMAGGMASPSVSRVSDSGGGGGAVAALRSQLAMLRTHLANPTLVPFPSVADTPASPFAAGPEAGPLSGASSLAILSNDQLIAAAPGLAAPQVGGSAAAAAAAAAGSLPSPTGSERLSAPTSGAAATIAALRARLAAAAPSWLDSSKLSPAAAAAGAQPSLPSQTSQLLRSGLSTHIRGRTPTAGQLSAGLEPICEQLHEQETAKNSSGRVRRLPRRSATASVLVHPSPSAAPPALPAAASVVSSTDAPALSIVTLVSQKVQPRIRSVSRPGSTSGPSSGPLSGLRTSTGPAVPAAAARAALQQAMAATAPFGSSRRIACSSQPGSPLALAGSGGASPALFDAGPNSGGRLSSPVKPQLPSPLRATGSPLARTTIGYSVFGQAASGRLGSGVFSENCGSPAASSGGATTGGGAGPDFSYANGAALMSVAALAQAGASRNSAGPGSTGTLNTSDLFSPRHRAAALSSNGGGGGGGSSGGAAAGRKPPRRRISLANLLGSVMGSGGGAHSSSDANNSNNANAAAPSGALGGILGDAAAAAAIPYRHRMGAANSSGGSGRPAPIPRQASGERSSSSHYTEALTAARLALQQEPPSFGRRSSPSWVEPPAAPSPTAAASAVPFVPIWEASAATAAASAAGPGAFGTSGGPNAGPCSDSEGPGSAYASRGSRQHTTPLESSPAPPSAAVNRTSSNAFNTLKGRGTNSQDGRGSTSSAGGESGSLLPLDLILTLRQSHMYAGGQASGALTSAGPSSAAYPASLLPRLSGPHDSGPGNSLSLFPGAHNLTFIPAPIAEEPSKDIDGMLAEELGQHQGAVAEGPFGPLRPLSPPLSPCMTTRVPSAPGLSNVLLPPWASPLASPLASPPRRPPPPPQAWVPGMPIPAGLRVPGAAFARKCDSLPRGFSGGRGTGRGSGSGGKASGSGSGGRGAGSGGRGASGGSGGSGGSLGACTISDGRVEYRPAWTAGVGQGSAGASGGEAYRRAQSGGVDLSASGAAITLASGAALGTGGGGVGTSGGRGPRLSHPNFAFSFDLNDELLQAARWSQQSRRGSTAQHGIPGQESSSGVNAPSAAAGAAVLLGEGPPPILSRRVSGNVSPLYGSPQVYGMGGARSGSNLGVERSPLMSRRVSGLSGVDVEVTDSPVAGTSPGPGASLLMGGGAAGGGAGVGPAAGGGEASGELERRGPAWAVRQASQARQDQLVTQVSSWLRDALAKKAERTSDPRGASADGTP